MSMGSWLESCLQCTTTWTLLIILKITFCDTEVTLFLEVGKMIVGIGGEFPGLTWVSDEPPTCSIMLPACADSSTIWHSTSQLSVIRCLVSRMKSCKGQCLVQFGRIRRCGSDCESDWFLRYISMVKDLEKPHGGKTLKSAAHEQALGPQRLYEHDAKQN